MEGLNDFHYAISLAQQKWDVDFKDVEDAEELGLEAYRLIGNHRTRLYKVTEPIDCQTQTIDLPCNVLYIEAVTYNCREDWENSSDDHEYGNQQSRYVEGYIEANKRFTDPLYQSGSFVKYRREGDKLHVDKASGMVTVLYHGELLDDNGLPYLTNKEATAIADYLAYSQTFKQAKRDRDQFLFSLAQQIEKKWLFHCDAARVPEYISQNDMDKILDAKTSWNRKKYHFSYKPTL